MRSEHKIGEQKQYDSIQSLFDDIYVRMVEQGKPSRRDSGVHAGACTYRGPDDTACAIGIVLTDDTCERFELEERNPTLQSHMMSAEVCGIRETLLTIDTPLSCRFFSEIQSCHDDAPPDTFLASFKEKALEVAKRFGLTVPLVE